MCTAQLQMDVTSRTSAFFDSMGLFEMGGDIETNLVAKQCEIRVIAQACEASDLFIASTEKFANLKREHELRHAQGERLVAAFDYLAFELLKARSDEAVDSAIRLSMPLLASYLPVMD